MNRYLLTVLLLVFGVSSFARELRPGQIPGMKVLASKSYDGTSLYGYINGGSVLYFEYGFDRLLVQEVELEGEKITVEWWQMKSTASAFGIYSVNTFNCATADQGGTINCQNPYQLQFCQGHYYISIVNSSGSGQAWQQMAKVTQQVREVVPEAETIGIPEFESGKPALITGNLKYFKGNIGLENGKPDWSPYFDGLENYELWICSFGKIVEASIRFQDNWSLEQFIVHTGLKPEGNGWISHSADAKWVATKTGDWTIRLLINE